MLDRPATELPPPVFESVPDEIERPRDQIAAFWTAFDNCVIAANHLGEYLKDRPPASASMADGIRRYGAGTAAFELWMGWRSILLLGEAGDAVLTEIKAGRLVMAAAEGRRA